MADATQATPLPDEVPEEPVVESPKADDSAVSDKSGEENGKDVSFGTFLTVGPKEYRNTTIVGFNGLNGTVRAVRRSGDRVENIQIPYKEYKVLLEAQRSSDLSTGRRTKKNLSKAVRGYFGKRIFLEGKPSQIIGYDAQSDEVLVSDEVGGGRHWMKSGEMLRSTQGLSRATVPATPTATSSRAKSRNLRAPKSETSEKVATVKTEEESLEILDKDIRQGVDEVEDELEDPKLKDRELSKEEVLKKIPVDVLAEAIANENDRLESLAPGGKVPDEIRASWDESYDKLALFTSAVHAGKVPEWSSLPSSLQKSISSEANVTVEAESTSASAPTSSGSNTTTLTATIGETREALRQQRSTSAGASPIQNASAVIAIVAAAIPASDTGATAVIGAAQNVLASYAASSAARESQMQNISSQILEVSNTINDLQQRSRTASASGNNVQAEQFQQQMSRAQTTRDGLLRQQMNLQVTSINEENKVDQMSEALQELVPDESGVIPDEKVAAVQKLLPGLTSSRAELGGVAGPSNAAAAAALPTPSRVAPPRSYAPSAPSGASLRSATARQTPSARTPKPLRPLGGSLSTMGGQTQRAVDFNAEQQRDRRNGNGFSGAGLEEAMSQEGGLPKDYSSPLYLPESKPERLYPGPDDTTDEDFFGAQDEANKVWREGAHRGPAGEEPGIGGQPAPPSETIRTPAEESEMAPDEAPAPAGLSPAELSRLSAFVAQSGLRQGQQQEQAGAQNALAQVESTKKKIATAKRTISDIIDAFDAVHGLADVVGLLKTFGHLNLRLVLTFFKTDLPFTPRAGFPYEAAAIVAFDLFVCLSALMNIIGPIIILAAIIAAFSSATFGLSDVVGGWLNLF